MMIQVQGWLYWEVIIGSNNSNVSEIFLYLFFVQPKKTEILDFSFFVPCVSMWFDVDTCTWHA